ncbi:kinase-like protein [Dacryopinax primogenitus]|uniref:Kinase-like protein n=1 Tax=Dacryopinax primogenitus (strain DJM 731) TaxID=1858805 RepID=M5GAT6_DACPD|nr:kinase-like protein [Dacryopinax primogenitus]EJU05490.1 kinase-like protein [Dacryopinax primogenitus]
MRGKHYRVAYEHGLDPNSIEGILCGNNPDHRTEVLKRVFAGCFGKRWWAEGEGIISGATYTISIQDERCIITTSSPTTPGVAIQPSLWWLRRVSIDELVRAELITPQVDKVYYNDGLYVYKSYPLYLESDMDLLKAVRISVRLQHSPYIINVHALVVHQKKCVGFLMPFAAMGSLLQARRNRVFSSWMRRRQFAHDIVRGVQALHSINEFHGDLNPRNVVLQFVPELEDRPRAQLIDLEANGGRTPPFMDPRLVNESEPSAQQDVHSTGKILLWLALDQLIDEDQWRRYDLPMELPEYIDPWFRNAIELCLDGGCTISELARIFEQNM